MILVDNKLYNYSYIKNKFTISTIVGMRITDCDDEGTPYNKTIRYMKNKSLIDNSLLAILNTQPGYVRRIIDYILVKLEYGTNVIELKGTAISEFENIDVSDVSRGITRLVELGIIDTVASLPQFKNNKVKKNLYVVNHNYIFRGNQKELIKEFIEQEKENNL